MTEPAEIEARVSAFLTSELGGDLVTITDLERIGVGRSRDNWIFDLVRADGQREPLILRMDPDGGLVDTDRATEFAVLSALSRSDVPAPVPRWLDASGAAMGRPSLIMLRASGSCDYRVVNGDRPLAERVGLARQLCDLLAAVHGVAWQDVGLGQVFTDPGEGAAAFELARWEATLRQDQLEAYPELDLALDRLRTAAPRSVRTVLVHADFKPGNVLLEGDRVATLLDWELAHLGDPLEDLGWVTQPLRTREHLIPDAWSAEDLVARYEHASGHDVDPAALAWWSTFATFKTAVMQVSGMRAFLDGRSDEPFRPNRKVLATLLATLPRGGA